MHCDRSNKISLSLTIFVFTYKSQNIVKGRYVNNDKVKTCQLIKNRSSMLQLLREFQILNFSMQNVLKNIQ